MSCRTYDIAIIGFGAAGIGAAKHAVYSNFKTLVFTGEKGEKKRSRSVWVYELQNVPGLEETSLSSIAKEQRQRLELGFPEIVSFVDGTVSGIALDEESGLYFLALEGGGCYKARFVIVAVGDTDVQPDIAGEIKPIFPYTRRIDGRSPSVHYCLRCDGHTARGKNFAVIGYSKETVLVAELLRARSVVYENSSLSGNVFVKLRPRAHLLLNGKRAEFGESEEKLLKEIGFEVHPEPIVKILGDEHRGILHGFLLESGETVEASVAFVNLGTRGRNPLYPSLKIIGLSFSERNRIKVDVNGETSLRGIFAVGDNVEGKPKQIASHWHEALLIIKEIERRSREERRRNLLLR